MIVVGVLSALLALAGRALADDALGIDGVEGDVDQAWPSDQAAPDDCAPDCEAAGETNADVDDEDHDRAADDRAADDRAADDPREPAWGHDDPADDLAFDDEAARSPLDAGASLIEDSLAASSGLFDAASLHDLAAREHPPSRWGRLDLALAWRRIDQHDAPSEPSRRHEVLLVATWRN